MAVPREVVILGGGISGLTAAWSLIRSSCIRSWKGSDRPAPNITIIEPSKTVGGCLLTAHGPAGSVLEQGPRGLRPSGLAGRASLNLCASVGMEDEVIVAGKDHPGAANRYVFAKNKLSKLPTGLSDVALNLKNGDFLTKALVKGMLTEPFAPKPNPNYFSSLNAKLENDESVFDFASRRLGRDVAVYMMDPLCVGIFGGDSRTLSLKSSFPSIAAFEELEGSLLLGAIRNDVNTPPLPPAEPGTERLLAKVEGARVWSLQRGIQSLATAVEKWLVKTGKVKFEFGTRCTRLAQHEDGSKINVHLAKGKEPLCVDHVISTVSAKTLASLTRKDAAPCAEILDEMVAHSMVVVNFVFRGNLLPVDGFGYLVPTVEPGNKILGVVFDSCAFPQQDDAYLLGAELGTITRVTVMSGGYKYDEIYGKGPLDEEYAIRLSREALRTQLSVLAEPIHVDVKPWMDCMPQYTIGHATRVENIHTRVAQKYSGCLSVIGNAFGGVGVNDCVLNATTTSENLVLKNAV
eukprot:m.12901 g.12901  ORF g.12901 m.12901 type:complete len:519 (-) comp9500_c0_seq1:47-1603(-)